MSHRLLLPVMLAVAAAPAAAQHVAASRPPARTFGGDRTSTGEPFTGLGVTSVGMTCDAPAAPVARTCTGFLPSFDGTLLEAVVRVPQTPRPGAGYPLVVTVHGWGGSAGSMGKYDDRLTGAGYAVLRYSTRGFGASWGQANLADVSVEGLDLHTMIGLVADDAFARDAAGNPTSYGVDPCAVAVFGASYGGAHAWLAALVPSFKSPSERNTVTIRTVVPVATWSDLLNGLVPNGRPEQAHEVTGAEKFSFVLGFYLGGLRTRVDRPYPNYPGYLSEWTAEITASEAPYSATPLRQQVVDGVEGYRSVYWQQALWDRIAANKTAGLAQLPIFLVQGWTDDLFPAGEALRMYDALRSVDGAYPVSLYLGDVGHPRAVNKSGELDHLLDLVVAWLDSFLKGSASPPAMEVQAAITRPRDASFTTADVVHVPTFADLATGLATHRFGGVRVITFDPLSLSGLGTDPLLSTGCAELNPCPVSPPSDVVPGDVAAYVVPAAALGGGAPFLVAGEPSVSFWAVTFAHRVQLDVRIFDVAPGGASSLVTRGTFTVDTGSPARPIGVRRVRVPTFGNLWEVAPDHSLRVEITNVDSPYLRPSLVPSVTLIADVLLSVPTRPPPR